MNVRKLARILMLFYTIGGTIMSFFGFIFQDVIALFAGALSLALGLIIPLLIMIISLNYKLAKYDPRFKYIYKDLDTKDISEFMKKRKREEKDEKN